MMEYEKELKKSPKKFIKDHLNYDPKRYKKSAKIETPQVRTKNTICGSNKFGKEGHWIRLPRKIIIKLGMRVTYADTDFEVIIRRKQ
jgi:hypothetical protein